MIISQYLNVFLVIIILDMLLFFPSKTGSVSMISSWVSIHFGCGPSRLKDSEVSSSPFSSKRLIGLTFKPPRGVLSASSFLGCQQLFIVGVEL